MPSPADPLLTLDDAADALGTGPDFVTHLITTGQLDHHDQGGQLRIPQSALIAYAINTAGPVATPPVLSAIGPTTPDAMASAA